MLHPIELMVIRSLSGMFYAKQLENLRLREVAMNLKKGLIQHTHFVFWYGLHVLEN